VSSRKSIDIHPVTVLKSAQSLLVEDFIEELKKELSRGSPKLLVESRNLDDVSLPEILEDARTLPMFHEKKLIVAKGYDGLGKDDLDLLNEYSGAPASSSGRPPPCLRSRLFPRRSGFSDKRLLRTR